MSIKIHEKSDFESMRKAGLLAAQILDMISQHISPGVTTNRLNELCHNMIIENNAIPAPLNYKNSTPGYPNFPKSICTSVNNVVCHGIPNDKPLKDGDILNIDVTVILNGWHGDTSRMYFVGEPSIKAKRLIQVTYEAMMLGIEAVAPGKYINDIGAAIDNHVQKYGYSTVREYCGHGIGRIFHTEPTILHYKTKESKIKLEPGMFFTVEPMVNIGDWKTKLSSEDGWTVYTKDRSLSAQFEHTIGVTETGYEIFTLSPQGLNFPPYKII